MKRHNMYRQNTYRNQRGGAKTYDEADTIHFWANQMREHCLFLATELNGVAAASLRERAELLQIEFQRYINDNFPDIQIDSIALTEPEYQTLGDLSIPTLRRLLAELKSLKENVKLATEKRWIGFTYPAEINHMLKELKHFEESLEGNMTVDQVAKFYAEEAAEHTMLAHKLLDPATLDVPKSATDPAISRIDLTTLKAVKETKEAALELCNIDRTNLAASFEYVNKLNTAGEDLKQKIDDRQVKSIINPLLIAHEGRESQRGLLVMGRYAQRKANA